MLSGLRTAGYPDTVREGKSAGIIIGMKTWCGIIICMKTWCGIIFGSTSGDVSLQVP